jgi:hypothetical protein
MMAALFRSCIALKMSARHLRGRTLVVGNPAAGSSSNLGIHGHWAIAFERSSHLVQMRLNPGVSGVGRKRIIL